MLHICRTFEWTSRKTRAHSSHVKFLHSAPAFRHILAASIALHAT
jgi:hypothetical protein